LPSGGGREWIQQCGRRKMTWGRGGVWAGVSREPNSEEGKGFANVLKGKKDKKWKGGGRYRRVRGEFSSEFFK